MDCVRLGFGNVKIRKAKSEIACMKIPVREGFLERVEDWIYRSGRDYYSKRNGLVELRYAFNLRHKPPHAIMQAMTWPEWGQFG